MGRYREEPHRWYLGEKQLEVLIDAFMPEIALVDEANPNCEYIKKFGPTLLRKLQDMKSEVRTVNKQVRVFTGGDE